MYSTFAPFPDERPERVAFNAGERWGQQLDQFLRYRRFSSTDWTRQEYHAHTASVARAGNANRRWVRGIPVRALKSCILQITVVILWP